MQPWARKSLASLEAEANRSAESGRRLHRGLGLWDLTSLGIGCTIGAGIFVLTGTAAAGHAGPAVSLSFVLAAFACVCAALCYGELASMIPISGSAYTYAYATLGELVAWIIGWSLMLEYLMAAATVAVGWGGYFNSFIAELGISLPPILTTPPMVRTPGGQWELRGLVNLPAATIVFACTLVLSLGVRQSAHANNVMVLTKLLVIVLVIAFGASHVDVANWDPFIPEYVPETGAFGWPGVMTAAGIVFYAYIGFDAVSTSAQEAHNPRRTVPLSLIITLAICTVLYVGMSLVVTGLAPYSKLGVPHPVFVAVDSVGQSLAWLKPLVNVGAVVGLASAVLTTLYGQTRIFYAMSKDGLLPPAFSRVNARSEVPTHGTWYTGLLATALAGLLPIDVLGELVSIGTLMAFAIVCVGVVILRKSQPEAPRAFRVPGGFFVAIFGGLSCVWLMLSLPRDTWVRLFFWLALGLAVYFCYGSRNSRLR